MIEKWFTFFVRWFRWVCGWMEWWCQRQLYTIHTYYINTYKEEEEKNRALLNVLWFRSIILENSASDGSFSYARWFIMMFISVVCGNKAMLLYGNAFTFTYRHMHCTLKDRQHQIIMNTVSVKLWMNRERKKQAKYSSHHNSSIWKYE